MKNKLWEVGKFSPFYARAGAIPMGRGLTWRCRVFFFWRARAPRDPVPDIHDNRREPGRLLKSCNVRREISRKGQKDDRTTWQKEPDHRWIRIDTEWFKQLFYLFIYWYLFYLISFVLIRNIAALDKKGAAAKTMQPWWKTHSMVLAAYAVGLDINLIYYVQIGRCVCEDLQRIMQLPLLTAGWFDVWGAHHSSVRLLRVTDSWTSYALGRSSS